MVRALGAIGAAVAGSAPVKHVAANANEQAATPSVSLIAMP
jgi:hypothetical protein